MPGPSGSRGELRDRLLRLAAPLPRCFSPGNARLRFGTQEGSHDASELEAFARPLWGLAPLAAGGDPFPDAERYREGLAHGTDPQHPEFWGEIADHDQRIVEAAALAFALGLAPGPLWEPQSSSERSRIGAWLNRVNAVRPYENNWLYFRVLINAALRRLGMPHDAGRAAADLDRLESFHLERGWFEDGRGGNRDYYAAFVLHFYGLLYATLAGAEDVARAARLRNRAADFAGEFIHWFSPDGRALPFGRSQTYRFAQGAFWGALAFAGVEPFPLGVIKGLLLRHLRGWLELPIASDEGRLTLGYAYPNPRLAEDYHSHGSPYWAWKAFLPLALPEGHPFWRAEEAPLPPLPASTRQDPPGLLIAHDGDHTFALASGQFRSRIRHGAAKYAKFCYSTRFGFSVPAADEGLENQAPDSMLALSEDGVRYAVRDRHRVFERGDLSLGSSWLPWDDVEVFTWLVLRLPWHLRVHRIRTARILEGVEGGFASGKGGETALVGLTEGRTSDLLRAAPGTNLLRRDTVIPVLRGRLGLGEHWLACAVLGRPEAACPFRFRPTDLGFELGDPAPFYRWPADDAG